MINSSHLLPPPYCNSDERDIALGRFMYEYGKLEMQLLYLFHLLSGTQWAIARVIFSVGFQSKPLSDILKGLGQLRLKDSEQQTLKSLCKRYNSAALKRNKIIHGLWEIEQDINFPLGQWTRISYPPEPSKEKQIFDKQNQKVRSNYRFTIKQLQDISSHIDCLTKDIAIFNSLIINQLLYPEQS